jgi:hypothetical protein
VQYEEPKTGKVVSAPVAGVVVSLTGKVASGRPAGVVDDSSDTVVVNEDVV